MAREKRERGHEAYALHLLGEVVARRTPGDASAAEAAFRQASALAEELSMRPLLAHCHVSRARLECRAGRAASARPLFDAATAAFRDLRDALLARAGGGRGRRASLTSPSRASPPAPPRGPGRTPGPAA